MGIPLPDGRGSAEALVGEIWCLEAVRGRRQMKRAASCDVAPEGDAFRRISRDAGDQFTLVLSNLPLESEERMG